MHSKCHHLCARAQGLLFDETKRPSINELLDVFVRVQTAVHDDADLRALAEQQVEHLDTEAHRSVHFNFEGVSSPGLAILRL